MTISPKLEYSCQNSLLTGPVEDLAPLTVVGDGACVNSAVAFRSFLGGSDGTEAEVQAIAKQCRLLLYDEPDCDGAKFLLEPSRVMRVGCTFMGGRSARLECDGHAVQQGKFVSNPAIVILCIDSPSRGIQVPREYLSGYGTTIDDQ